MFTDEDLTSAISAGALSEIDAERFRSYLVKRRSLVPADDETVRLAHNFNDVFVSLGLATVIFAAGSLVVSLAETSESASVLALGGLLVCLACWRLSKHFTRRKRMALPSIILFLAFVAGAAAIPLSIATAEASLPGDEAIMEFAVLVSTVAATIAAWRHWCVFQVPISVAVIVLLLLGTTGLAVLLLAQFISPALPEFFLPAILFLSGIVTFVFAMAMDASDRKRITRRSDIAFWLHLAAAPLIVHPVFQALGVMEGSPSGIAITLSLLIYAGLACLAIAIDRRALLVSALVYMVYALSHVLAKVGVIEFGFAMTAFAIGSGILSLSAFWGELRYRIVRRLPLSIQAQLPEIIAPREKPSTAGLTSPNPRQP